MATGFPCYPPSFYLPLKMQAVANAGVIPCVKSTNIRDICVGKKEGDVMCRAVAPGATLFADVQPGGSQRVLALNRRFIDAFERHAIKFQCIAFVVERVNIPFLRHVI